MTEPLNWSIATEQSATSTSDLAKRAAANGAPSGHAFLAIEQTAGRGRHGRYWDSQKGGMYLSVLIRPSVPVDQWFAFSFAALTIVLHYITIDNGELFCLFISQGFASSAFVHFQRLQGVSRQ